MKSDRPGSNLNRGMFINRKGMGMELALLVLLVVFGCSILLVSSALIGKSNLNDRKDQMIERFELDKAAEQLMAGEEIDENKYVVTQREDNVLEIKLIDGNILLVVSWENGVITRWDYK